jgi:hypothetical protein
VARRIGLVHRVQCPMRRFAHRLVMSLLLAAALVLIWQVLGSS